MIRKLLIPGGAILALLYLGLCGGIYLFQRRLQYFPEVGTPEGSRARAAAAGLVPWPEGSAPLWGWRRESAGQAPFRVLVLPGNAGNALDRIYFVRLVEALGGEAVLMEYPGYGCRPGSPGQAELVAAALAAVDRLAGEGPLFLLGESLGSGVAVQAAAARPGAIRGLLLVTPYASMVQVAARTYPWLPARLLLQDRWDSVGAMAGYPGPVALLLAGRDEVVGVEEGRALARAVPGRKQVWVQPEAGHNTLSLDPGRGGWSAAMAFLRDEEGPGGVRR